MLLSHDNDGVTKFGPSLINRRPAWLGPHRPRELQIAGRSPRGIPSSMKWRMVTTFYQILIDMKNAQIPGSTAPGPTTTDLIFPISFVTCSILPASPISSSASERHAGSAKSSAPQSSIDPLVPAGWQPEIQ